MRMCVEMGSNNLLLSDVILKTCQSKLPGNNDPFTVSAFFKFKKKKSYWSKTSS